MKNQMYHSPTTEMVVIQIEGLALCSSDHVFNTAAKSHELPDIEVENGWESSFNDNPFND